LEYIRTCQELHQNGLYIELNAYQYHVFMDMRQVHDNEWRQYSQLSAYLEGRGVPSIEEALKELFLQPILTAYRSLVNREVFEALYALRQAAPLEGEKPAEVEPLEATLEEMQQKMQSLLTEARTQSEGTGEAEPIAEAVTRELAAILGLLAPEAQAAASENELLAEARLYLLAGPGGKTPLAEAGYPVWGALFAWAISHRLGCIQTANTDEDTHDWALLSRAWIDEWLLGKVIAQALQDLGSDEGAAWRAVDVVRLLTEHTAWYLPASEEKPGAQAVLQGLLKDSLVQAFLKVNRYLGLLYYNQESYDELLWWLFATCTVQVSAAAQEQEAEQAEQSALLDAYQLIRKLAAAGEKSEYLVDKLLKATSI
jgi:hypothetical protein